MRIFLCLFFLWIFPVAAIAAGDESRLVTISGTAPGYGGEELTFHTFTDRITFTQKELFTTVVGEDERFSVTFDPGEDVLYIFSHPGRYYTYLYVESGLDYEVVMPPRADKSAWESLNPYYEGIPTHIAVLNHPGGELNALIRDFDNDYDPLFGETLINLTVDRDRDLFDSIKSGFERDFGNSGNSYFKTYMRYRIAFLEIMAQLQSARYLSDNYFLNEPVLYANVAYMELFNQVYNRYFHFFGRTSSGRQIYDDINRERSLSGLLTTLKSDMVLGDGRLLELVVLKGLHDAFYGSDFSRSGLLTVLDSLAASTIYPEHRLIAGHIRDKVTRLLPGHGPPDFELMDRQGEIRRLDDFRGYYVYLNFCTAASYSCLSEYDLLNNLHDRHSGYLKIVTIFIDETYESMLTFLSKNDYGWDFLYYGNQPSLLRDYDVRMFPSYYFIDREGKLIMAPAPSPAENFENYLLRTMRSRRDFVR